MATLVLTAVGKRFGGPIGSAIGAFVGGQIDNAIFAPPAREGPRLKELDVQTSSYGSQIPAIFGAMRVAGTVIWATDLVERRNKSGGKGRPSTVNFSYSVSLAVALSSRPAQQVGRIWADGNLLRGAAGDLKADTLFRFYDGHSDQVVDPLIASSEADNPAYRGLCYAVFEDLQLADFGNRIPSLTFELFERDTPVPVIDIAQEASGRIITGNSDETLSGYAMQGADGRSALAPILSALPVIVRPHEDRLELRDWWSPVFAGIPASYASSDNSKKLDRPGWTRESDGGANALALRHYEPARDYQISIQRSQLTDAGRTAKRVDLPASISAASARRLADLQLLQFELNQSGWTGYILRDENQLHVGDYIVAPDIIGKWQAVAIEHFGAVSKLSAKRAIGSDPTAIIATEPGLNIPPPDFAIGDSYIMLMDLPVITGGDPGRPLVAIAASGTSGGWRRAALSLQSDNGLIELGATAPPAQIAIAENALPAHSPNLIDFDNAITLQLLNPRGELPEREVSLSDSSAPIFWMEGELIRAGRTDPLGDGRYRLSRLQRGCFGSEDSIPGHQAMENIVLLEPERLRILDEEYAAKGAVIGLEALGIGDTDPAYAQLTVTGEATTPPCPVHGRIAATSDGGLHLSWVRRSRVDYGWQDGVDQPLSEEGESYLVELREGEVVVASWQIAEPALVIGTVEISGLGWASGAQSRFEIRQFGRFARSTPMILDWVAG